MIGVSGSRWCAETWRTSAPGAMSEHAREVTDDLVPALPRQIAHPQLHGGAGDVRDDDAAAAVEQRPAGSLHADEAELVRLGRVQVRVAREHLQRPEAEEEHDEREQRDAAEDRRRAARAAA